MCFVTKIKLPLGTLATIIENCTEEELNKLIT